MHLTHFRLVEKQSATVKTHTCALSSTSPFDGVFLTLKCKTLVLKHLHGDRAAAILLKMDIPH